uniref:Uncharacterized protein n=1 Tax=Strigamia maritima TaxID=126957 RepID=T1JNK3_STRMM
MILDGICGQIGFTWKTNTNMPTFARDWPQPTCPGWISEAKGESEVRGNEIQNFVVIERKNKMTVYQSNERRFLRFD